MKDDLRVLDISSVEAGAESRGGCIPGIQIVLMAIVAAITYGVVHDQVTARVCVEYFTIGHPPLFDTTNPTLLGLGWGIVATWWVGLILGVPLALVARVGSWPKTQPAALWKPIGVLLGCMGVCALIAGSVGYAAAQGGGVFLVGPLETKVPIERHHLFIADAWAHVASYLSGFVGGVVVLVVVARSRWKASRAIPRVSVSGETGSKG